MRSQGKDSVPTRITVLIRRLKYDKPTFHSNQAPERSEQVGPQERQRPETLILLFMPPPEKNQRAWRDLTAEDFLQVRGILRISLSLALPPTCLGCALAACDASFAVGMPFLKQPKKASFGLLWKVASTEGPLTLLEHRLGHRFSFGPPFRILLKLRSGTQFELANADSHEEALLLWEAVTNRMREEAVRLGSSPAFMSDLHLCDVFFALCARRAPAEPPQSAAQPDPVASPSRELSLSAEMIETVLQGGVKAREILLASCTENPGLLEARDSFGRRWVALLPMNGSFIVSINVRVLG